MTKPQIIAVVKCVLELTENGEKCLDCMFLKECEKLAPVINDVLDKE